MSKPDFISGHVPSNVKRGDLAARSWVRINRVRRSYFVRDTDWFERIEIALSERDTAQLVIAMACSGNIAILPDDLAKELANKMILEYGAGL
jgi:hypothetical protein